MDITTAPVVLFVYNRPEHTARTLAALRQNRLANMTRLYVFSDGPRTSADRDAVNQVRHILDQATGFFDVVRIDRDVNTGLSGNIIDGVSYVLAQYDRVIVLEDDIVTAPSFLSYMNRALDCYQFSTSVFSISGYGVPIQLPRAYPHPVYLSPRSSSWGSATWRGRWEKADWHVSDYPAFKWDFRRRASFNRGGNDLSRMLDDQMIGRINSWDVIWAYTHFCNAAWCVYPVVSQVVNIGTDGTGTHHTTSTQKYQTQSADTEVVFPNELLPDADVIACFRSFWNVPLRHRIKVWLYRRWQWLSDACT
ncbi:glycosyltransferase [bacterium]|nr:glycosyltransferase [bacterium]